MEYGATGFYQLIIYGFLGAFALMCAAAITYEFVRFLRKIIRRYKLADALYDVLTYEVEKEISMDIQKKIKERLAA